MPRSSIQLSTGKYYDFLRPDPAVVTIKAIAHSLSNICRYTGHTSRFYSVAEHSVGASYIGDPRFALERLLHDGQEFVVGDMATPFKRLVGRAYSDHEDMIERIIARRWGLTHLDDPEALASVKHADLVMLATEKRDLLPVSDVKWDVLEGIEPLPDHIDTSPEAGTPWLWRDKFIERFVEISRDR